MLVLSISAEGDYAVLAVFRSIAAFLRRSSIASKVRPYAARSLPQDQLGVQVFFSVLTLLNQSLSLFILAVLSSEKAEVVEIGQLFRSKGERLYVVVLEPILGIIGNILPVLLPGEPRYD